MQLSQEEIGLLELALGETITALKNRFEEDAEFVHPAKKYEALYDKLTAWSEQLPASVYSLSVVDDDSVSLLERAALLVGNPGTNISGSTDLACRKWQEDYERWRTER